MFTSLSEAYPSLLIVHIPAVPERIERSQRIVCSCQGALQRRFSPRIVLVFYHKVVAAVNQADDISLQIVQVHVVRPVEIHHRRAALRVVVEVHFIRALLQVHEQFPVQRIRGFRAIDNFAHAQAVRVVLVLHRRAALAHLHKPPSGRPAIRPRAVVQRVTNGIVSNGLPIVRRQLVLPVAVAIRIGDCLQRRSQRARGVRVPHLAGDVPAQVVIVHPRGARAPARGIVRVVHACELAQAVVCVGRSHPFARFAGDVAHVVICITEVHAVLCSKAKPLARGGCIQYVL